MKFSRRHFLKAAGAGGPGTVSPQVIAQAQAVALANSAPLKYNAEKIEMAKGLLASGLEKLALA